eukprot:COSAG05_NODE_8781_length_672_cov_1.045375_1_plen_70_part_00
MKRPTAQVLAECWLAEGGTFAVVATNHGDSSVQLDVSVDVSLVGFANPRLLRVNTTMTARSMQVLPLAH